MSVYVRIPRRPNTKPTYKWAKFENNYVWDEGACWYVDNRIEYHYWNVYSAYWDANGDLQKGEYLREESGGAGFYPEDGPADYDADGIYEWYVYTGSLILGSDQSYWQYDWSAGNTVTSTNRSEYPDSFTEYIPDFAGGGGNVIAMQPCYRYVGEESGRFVEYVYSEDENAYPDGKHTDGYWYSKIS